MSTSQRASESLPPDTATRTGSSRVNIRCLWIASATCFLKNSTKCGEQNAALWRLSSSAAEPPHFRHFMRGLRT